MAFAAVISLVNTLKRLENLINPEITKSAYEELSSLGAMLKRLDDRSSRSIDRSAINELDADIRDAVRKVEDVLESYQLSQGVVDKEIYSFLKMANKLRGKYERVLKTPLPLQEDEAAVSPLHKSTTLGLSDLSEQIIDELVYGVYGPLETVTFVGMVGIGKTHLASLIYHHPLILQNFKSRAWVRVGPKDHIRNIFVKIVAQILRKPIDIFEETSMLTLRHLLRKSLRYQRYLIVLDDIWSTQVLDYFILLLCTDSWEGSRLLLTTRLQEVAEYRRCTHYHQVPFLDDEESWDLLWKSVFVDESNFPFQLEKAGRKIAELCEGLPLLILAVSNILRGLDLTEEYWNKVAEKKTNTFKDAYEQIYSVILPSYEYLPQHLKACFLYMGVFPQSCEIRMSYLINLWTVEDFLEPSQHKKLEMYAMDFMEDIVSRSLAIVCTRSLTRFRRTKSSKLHSVYWHLCVTEARKSKLFHVLNKLTDVSTESQRRFSVQNNILLGINEVYDSMVAATSTTRSLLCTGEDHQYPVRVCFNMMLLMRVLDAHAIRFYEFPEEVLKLLQLRYLALTHNGELPSSISKLQLLQCLILRQHHNIKLLRAPKPCLPMEIWKLHELRHLRITGSNLPDPIYKVKLPNLLALYVNAHNLSKHVFRSIPNLKKLEIKIELQPDAAETLRCFQHIKVVVRLESLKCVVVNPPLRPQSVDASPDRLSNFPRGLKKLSLNGLGYSWEYMSAIALLPSLEVLKLRCYAFQGAEWKTETGQFKMLESLLLEDIDLVHWKLIDRKDRFISADPEAEVEKSKVDSINSKCFPSLRILIVRDCYKLKTIPCEIGEISTLEYMEVHDCSPSVVDSAHQIKEKTKSPHLQLVINSSWNL